MEERTYTYDKATGYYTNECNATMDYIIRNLPGVTVVAEKNNLVQVAAEKKAADIIEFFNECDMLCLFVGQTVEEILEMIEDE